MSAPARPTAASLISKYQLQSHPEGGHYSEIYVSPHRITPHPSTPLPPTFTEQPRPFCSNIYFLLSSRSPLSHLHRLAGDELWFHIGGRPLAVVELGDGGERRTVVGRVEDGYDAYHCVAGGQWFGAELVSDDKKKQDGGAAAGGEEGEEEWALVCCVVSGSFFFSEFQLGQRSELLKQFPKSAELVTKFTRQE